MIIYASCKWAGKTTIVSSQFQPYDESVKGLTPRVYVNGSVSRGLEPFFNARFGKQILTL